MTLKAQIEADLDSVFFNTDEFAEVILYNGKEIKAIVDYGDGLAERDGAVVSDASIIVKKSDVSDPAYRDPVTMGGESWSVISHNSGDSYTWNIRLKRNERPTFKR